MKTQTFQMPADVADLIDRGLLGDNYVEELVMYSGFLTEDEAEAFSYAFSDVRVIGWDVIEVPGEDCRDGSEWLLRFERNR